MSDIDDGGPAFPGPFSGHCGYDNHADPCDCYVKKGMTLRDYFAGKVILAYVRGASIHVAAQRAYALADAMIQVRNLKKPAQ